MRPSAFGGEPSFELANKLKMIPKSSNSSFIHDKLKSNTNMVIHCKYTSNLPEFPMHTLEYDFKGAKFLNSSVN